MRRFSITTGLLSGFLFGIATLFSKLLFTKLNSFHLAGLLHLSARLAMLPYIFRKNNLKLLFQLHSPDDEKLMNKMGIFTFMLTNYLQQSASLSQSALPAWA